MPVDTRKAAYDKALPEWQIVRDCIAGERAIKDKSQEYLPVPSGMKKGVADPAYKAYKVRSRFPDIVAPTVRGLIGTMFRKSATVELPTRIEYLMERATPDGLTLESLAKRVAREVLITGRSPLLVDAQRTLAARPQPYLVSYDAENMINWQEHIGDGSRFLSLSVLETDEQETPENDPFGEDHYTRYLALMLQDGRYVQAIYERRGKQDPQLIGTIEPTRRGEALDEIPLVVIGATDILPDIDEIPLIGLCHSAIAIYQQYADYRQALFMTSQPTAVRTGVQPGDPDLPEAIGSGTVWDLGSEQAKAFFLEFSGAGTGAQRQAIEDEYSHAAQLGANMLEQTKRAAEAAESLRLRQSSQSATLHSIARSVGDGMLQCLRWAAIWADADPAEVIYEPNMDFVDAEITPQMLQAISQSWQAGLYPKSVANYNLRKAEFIPSEVTDEDLASELDSEGPALGTIGLEREPEETDEAA